MAEKYRSVQVGRAFAAIIVVLLHSYDVSNDFAPHGLGFPRYLSPGYAGVDVFFVISGFIIALVADRPGITPGDFLWRRAIRILPFYWLFTLLWFFLAGAVGHDHGPRDLIGSLLLLPLAQAPVLVVGWTLEQELIFYLVVAALIALRRLAWLPWAMAGLTAAGIAWHLAWPGLWDYRIFSLYQMQFLFGVLLYRFRAQIVALPAPLLLAGGVLGFVASGICADWLYPGVPVATKPEGLAGLARVTMFGLSAVLLIGGLLALERQAPRLFETRGAKLAIAIGDASYVLYLSHLILFGIAGSLVAASGLAFGWAVPVLALTEALAIGFALSFHRTVERPVLERLQRRRAPLAAGAA